MKKYTYYFLFMVILVVSLLAACESDTEDAPVFVATLPGAPDIPSRLAPIEPYNAGAIEVLGVLQVNPIVGAAFRDDQIAVGRQDGTVDVLSLRDGALVTSLEGHKDPVRGLAFGADTLVTASDDGDLRVWSTGRWSQTYSEEADDWLRTITFSPDGQQFAAGGAVNDIHLLRTSSAGRQTSLSYGDATVRSIAFSSDGSLVAAGGRDGAVQLWRVDGGGPKGRLARHAAAVTALAFHPTNDWIISGDFVGEIRVWDVGSRLPVKRAGNDWVLSGNPSGVRSLTFNEAGTVLVAGYADGTIVLWDFERGRPLDRQFIQPSEQRPVDLLTVALLRGDEILAAATRSGQIWSWGAAPGALPSPTPTATDTPVPTDTPTPTLTLTPTLTATASLTPTITDTATVTPSPTITPTVQASDTPEPASATPTATEEEAVEASDTPEPEEDEDTPTPTSEADTSTPTATPTETATATVTDTATPEVEPCYVSPIGRENVNIRSGPGTIYRVTGVLEVGEEAEVIGQMVSRDRFRWWQLIDERGWVREDVVTATESCEDVPQVSFQ